MVTVEIVLVGRVIVMVVTSPFTCRQILGVCREKE